MADATPAAPQKPEWMDGYKPRGNASWIKGGPSPNPAGRPKGIVDKRQKVQIALMDDAPAVARVVIDAALEGDMQAASLVLARIAPSLRSQMQPVMFDFDATAPVARQVEQVLDGIASGAVPADIGRMVIDAIGTLAEVRASEFLEARINALEAKLA